MVDWIVLSLLGMLLLHRATTRGEGARIPEANTCREFAPGRDVHARSPWNAYPDYYL